VKSRRDEVDNTR